MRNFFILVLLSSMQVFAQGTDAAVITKTIIDIEQQEIQKLTFKLPQILNLDKSVCGKAASSTECLGFYAKTVKTKSPMELVALMKLVKDTQRQDFESKRLSDDQFKVKHNDFMIAVLENVDLSQSWIANYKLKYQVDKQFVETYKTRTVETMEQLKEKTLDQISKNSQAVMGSADNPRGVGLYAEAFAQVKKIKSIRDRKYRF